MKSEIIVKPHSVLPNAQVIEVWWNGRFIATVAGADGPGVRIISKHPAAVDTQVPMTTQITFNATSVTTATS